MLHVARVINFAAKRPLVMLRKYLTTPNFRSKPSSLSSSSSVVAAAATAAVRNTRLVYSPGNTDWHLTTHEFASPSLSLGKTRRVSARQVWRFGETRRDAEKFDRNFSREHLRTRLGFCAKFVGSISLRNGTRGEIDRGRERERDRERVHA